MGFDIDADEMDEWGGSKEVQKGGPGRPDPGDYHAQVEDAKEDDDKIELHCVIVSPGDQCGKTFKHQIWKRSNRTDENGEPIEETREDRLERKKRATQTAIRLGMISEEEYDRRLAAKQGVSLDFVEQAPGCQFIAHVVPNEFKDKRTGEQVKTTRAFINSINDERSRKNVKSWDQTLLAVLQGMGGGGGNSNGQEMAGAGVGTGSNGAASASKYDDI